MEMEIMTAAVRMTNSDFIACQRVFARAVEVVRVWTARSTARRDLAELDARDILDVGLDPAEVAREIAKPFWVA